MQDILQEGLNIADLGENVENTESKNSLILNQFGLTENFLDFIDSLFSVFVKNFLLFFIYFIQFYYDKIIYLKYFFWIFLV